MKTGKQMTAGAGASVQNITWLNVNWDLAWYEVRRLQMRIVKAIKEKRWNKVKALQHLITTSYYAKLLAVKRVTSNKGRNTPGVDKVIWKTIPDKMQAVDSLQKHGYKPQPLRRIYIPKKNGKKRPLSIPCMKDRAMQALHKLALSPVAETIADKNSYGFRECRSCADAIAASFNALSKPNSATWVLEGDIHGCFDNISHQWALENILMDKEVLKKWLKSGYVEGKKLYPSHQGTPQGGIISPCLANITLDGLEKVVHDSVPRRSRVNFIRYADDFIVTGKSKRILLKCVKPAIESFLKDRDLLLSEEKTKITHIKKGFTFLGQDIRKQGRVLHITPGKEGVLSLQRKLGELIRKHVSSPMIILITKINQIIRGWGNYHRYIVASETFSRIDEYIYEQLWRMLRKRHSNKSKRWIYNHYWIIPGHPRRFSVRVKTTQNTKVYTLFKLSSIKIKRYIKIIAKANPYEQEYKQYFWNRRHKKDIFMYSGLTK